MKFQLKAFQLKGGEGRVKRQKNREANVYALSRKHYISTGK